MNTIQMYDAQADSFSVEDIAANDNNRIMLSRMKRNSSADHDKLYIQNGHDCDGEDCEDYVPEGTKDMGWLGYFIGRNENLRQLSFYPFTSTSGAGVSDVLEPFFTGVNNNRSIHKLDFYDMDLLGGRVFTIMGPFFENNSNLSRIIINDCNLENDGWRLLALAIGSNKNKSLESVSFEDSNISDEALVDIITALSVHPNLEQLNLGGNRLATNGCITLATLLKCSCTELNTLNLTNNEINEEGIDALVPALKNCIHLELLKLDNNTSISTKGWQILASVLNAPKNSSLTTLSIRHNNIDDQAAAAFADALVNNGTLRVLYLVESSITDEGRKAFSKMLCDTSSVNSTFLSNHTLTYVTSSTDTRASLNSLFTLNKRKDKKEVAIIKILQYHDELDMMPFFEWEFKVLPLMIDWFERASSITMPENFQLNIGPRKLSSIYQFVRGMPLLYVETSIRKELENIKSKESQMEEEQLLLRQEQLMLDLRLQRLEQRRQSVKDDKESLLEKLVR